MRRACLCPAFAATPLAAQAPDPATNSPSARAIAIPDSARKYPRTYWQTGLIAGAAIGGLLGAGAAAGLCSMSETDTSCLGVTLGGALVIGTAGGTLGALMGSLFPRRPADRPDP